MSLSRSIKYELDKKLWCIEWWLTSADLAFDKKLAFELLKLAYDLWLLCLSRTRTCFTWSCRCCLGLISCLSAHAARLYFLFILIVAVLVWSITMIAVLLEGTLECCPRILDIAVCIFDVLSLIVITCLSIESCATTSEMSLSCMLVLTISIFSVVGLSQVSSRLALFVGLDHLNCISGDYTLCLSGVIRELVAICTFKRLTHFWRWFLS